MKCELVDINYVVGMNSSVVANAILSNENALLLANNLSCPINSKYQYIDCLCQSQSDDFQSLVNFLKDNKSYLNFIHAIIEPVYIRSLDSNESSKFTLNELSAYIHIHETIIPGITHLVYNFYMLVVSFLSHVIE